MVDYIESSSFLYFEIIEMNFFIPRCLTKLNCTGYSFAMYLKVSQLTLDSPTHGFVFSSAGHHGRVTFGGVSLLIIRGNLVLHFRRREVAKRWLTKADISDQANRWIHVTGTWSLSDGVKLYIDGSLSDTGTEGTFLLGNPDLPNTMHIGRVGHRNETYTQFVLDEWYFWDQELNGDEVMQVYAAYQPGTYTFLLCIVLLRL